MEEGNNDDNVVDAEIISDSGENENMQERETADKEKSEDKIEEESAEENKRTEAGKKSAKEKERHKHPERHEAKEEKKDEDEVEVKIDWKKAAKMLDSHWLWTILILIPIILTITIRVQPNSLAITEEWARSTVYNVYRNSILQQISSTYPNLPDANKQNLTEQQFQAYLKSNSATIENQVKQTAAYFKSKMQYDVNGTSYTYLGDLDSYYFLRYAENYLKTGRQADEIRNGTNWDNHMLAPIGTAMTPTMHPYSIAYLYKFLRLFNKNITPMQASFYVPLVCAVIAAIAAFMIGKRLAGNIAGLSASVLVSVNTMFLSRTMGSDTDVYNVMFPLLIIWMVIEAFESEKSRDKAVFAGLAGLLTGIFSLAWMGWWYIFDFMIAAIGAYTIYLLFEMKKKEKSGREIAKKQLKKTILITAIFFASSALFVSLFSSIQDFTAFITGPFQVMNLKEVVHQTLWPNVYLTVAELNPGSFSTTLSVMGGWLFFLLAIAGVAFAFLNKDKNGYYDIRTAVLLLIWFAGTSYATLKGVRFSLLVVPAFAIAAGVALGNIFNIANRFATRELKIHKYISYATLLVLLGLVLMPQIRAGYAAGKSYVPSMNDAWYNSLTKIKEQSAPNAIINSWWDFGHWFKYVADRAVTADGASQNSPQAYWLGRILVTNDEHEAIAVLRMLDCGSNTAFEIIDKKNNDTAKSMEMLRKAIMMNRTEAEEYLSQYLNKSDVDAVLNNIDCKPPEDYFITSGDMVGKSGVWAHFGLWDFNRAKLLIAIKNSNLSYATELMKQMNYSNAQIEQTIYNISSLASSTDEENWISPWPGYLATNGYCQYHNSTNISLCSNNLQGQNVMVLINWTNMSAISAGLYTGQNLLKPYSFVYYENGSLIEEKYEKPDFPYSIILTPNNETVIASPELSKSIFTRLFFMNGAGLDHFTLFDHETEITGSEIYVWKVNWN